jgi:hypothetical protein
MWQEYLAEYAKSRPECLNEWKSSPLASDHSFIEAELSASTTQGCSWDVTKHLTQILDLRTHKWGDIRKSYHSIIHRGQEQLEISEDFSIALFRKIHQCAFGSVRSLDTFAIQNNWLLSGNAMVMSAINKKDECVAVAFWIVYQGCAYYASAPSLEKNTMHAVIWKSLKLLKARGVTLVEMGQIDGETEKEKGIAQFKMGWGGEAKPFTIVRRLP